MTSPEVRLARRIQAEIKSLVESGTMTGSAGDRRPLRYGDMLVLVRRRGNAFDAVIQALKHAGIPVAGADRLKLTEHIAIIDLMNLADALLLPQDDLALAVALKSPLFGLDDDDLFKLAWQRRGSLREALRHACRDGEKIQDRAGAPGSVRAPCCRARRRLPSMPGCSAATAAGSAFCGGSDMRPMTRSTNFSNSHWAMSARRPPRCRASWRGCAPPTLEVKRDMEISRDEVRVMTVHGAKGLEAPVVFLVDTTSSPSDTQRLRLIHLPHGNAAPHMPGVVVWAGRKADDPAAVAAARTAMLGDTEDEYRRLLYVAMTRAADRLIVGGCMPGNMNTVRKFSWYDLIGKGLENSGLHLQTIETSDGMVKRYARPEDAVARDRGRRHDNGGCAQSSCHHGCRQSAPPAGRRRYPAAPLGPRRG